MPGRITHQFRSGELTPQDAAALNQLVDAINRLRFTAAPPLICQDDAAGVRIGLQGSVTGGPGPAPSSPSFRGAWLSGPANSLASGSEPALSFNAPQFDTDGYWNNAHPTRLTLAKAGYYLATAYLQYDANASGSRLALIKAGGISALGYEYVNANANGGVTWLSIATTPFRNNVFGGYIELFGFQDSGGSLGCFPNLGLVYLGT